MKTEAMMVIYATEKWKTEYNGTFRKNIDETLTRHIEMGGRKPEESKRDVEEDTDYLAYRQCYVYVCRGNYAWA